MKNMAFERIDIHTCTDQLQNALHRDRYDFVLARIDTKDRLLEVGTGLGVFTEKLCHACNDYIGLEYDPYACKETYKRTLANIIQGDARSLPFKDETFSKVVCLEVLEHLGDYKASIREIWRCIRQNGTAIISVPYRKHGGKSATNKYHLYEPGEAELVGLFKKMFIEVEIFYQYFEESLLMTVARKLHIRRFLGFDSIYRALSLGLPSATSHLRIEKRAHGMKESLIVVASVKLAIS